MTRTETPTLSRAGVARSTGPARVWRRSFLGLIVLVAGLGLAPVVRADGIELTALEIARSDDGVQLSFATRFQLPRPVEDALDKGVPLYFVADATLYRSRWYWRDVRIARTQRSWRLAWQPLTRSYRVSFGGLGQSFDRLDEALAALRGSARWHIADTAQLEPGARHYVEFSYRLDLSQLPRPMQLDLPGQADWSLSVERSVALE